MTNTNTNTTAESPETEAETGKEPELADEPSIKNTWTKFSRTKKILYVVYAIMWIFVSIIVGEGLFYLFGWYNVVGTILLFAGICYFSVVTGIAAGAIVFFAYVHHDMSSRRPYVNESNWPFSPLHFYQFFYHILPRKSTFLTLFFSSFFSFLILDLVVKVTYQYQYNVSSSNVSSSNV